MKYCMYRCPPQGGGNAQTLRRSLNPEVISKLPNVFTSELATFSYIKINSNLLVYLIIGLTNMSSSSNVKEDSAFMEELNRKVAFVATLKLVSRKH